MPQVRFEPTISAGERPPTYALDCAAIGNRQDLVLLFKIPTDARKNSWKFIDNFSTRPERGSPALLWMFELLKMRPVYSVKCKGRAETQGENNLTNHNTNITLDKPS